MRNIFQPKTKTTVPRICVHCSTNFFAYNVNQGRGKYCSKACFKASRAVSLKCDYCGIAFSRTISAVSRYGIKNFCSKRCSHLSRRKNPNRVPIKRLRYGSGAFQRARKAVIERDGMCQICSNTLATSVHHIDWNPYNHSLENLVLLCKRCHGRLQRWEDWTMAKGRIMACSELCGDTQNAAEMPASA